MYKYTKAMALLLLLSMAVLMFAGCTSKGANSSEGNASPTQTAGNTKTDDSGKKVLNVAKLIELQAADQHKVNDGMSNELLTAIFDGLYTLDTDGKVDPLMAESYEVSPDGLTYTFHIRDAKWSNGDKVTANDFVFSWRRLVDKNTAAKNSNEAVAAGIKNADAIVNGDMDPAQLGVSAKDDSTLVVQLEAPVPYFLATLIRPAFLPINQKFFEQAGSNYGMSPENTVSNGPFKWTYWDNATNITVEKNDTYWNVSNIDIDKINWKIVKDSQTGALMFENGELDFQEISGDLIDKYASDSRFKAALEVHMWYMIPNFQNKALANENIRKALAISYDKDAIANQVMKNGAQAADYFVGYKLAFGPDGKQFRDTTGTYLHYDVAAAQKFWTAGLKELGVNSLNLNLLYWDDDASVGQSEFIASEWEKNLPGLSATLNSMPKSAANEKAGAGDFDMYLFRWGPDYKDPMAFLELLASDSSRDFGKYKNDEYDSIISAARKPEMLNNLDARWESLKRAEKIILEEDAGIFPTVQNGLGMLINPKVHGLDVRNTGLTWNYRFVTKDN